MLQDRYKETLVKGQIPGNGNLYFNFQFQQQLNLLQQSQVQQLKYCMAEQSNFITAKLFFEACEQGKGWQICKQYCHEDATFSCQNQVLKNLTSLKDYPQFMVAIHKMMLDARYELISFSEDKERQTVTACAVFKGTHTGQKNPHGLEATQKATSSDYSYAMTFDGNKIKHMTKVWNHSWAFQQLGWM